MNNNLTDYFNSLGIGAATDQSSLMGQSKASGASGSKTAAKTKKGNPVWDTALATAAQAAVSLLGSRTPAFSPPGPTSVGGASPVQIQGLGMQPGSIDPNLLMRYFGR